VPARDHVHMYVRVGKRGKNPRWKCNDPDCTHFTTQEIVSGKRSRCDCGETFILDAGALQRRKPKCLMCRDTKQSRKYQKIANLMEAVEIGQPVSAAAAVRIIREDEDETD
jgi:hypothetical protein